MLTLQPLKQLPGAVLWCRQVRSEEGTWIRYCLHMAPGKGFEEGPFPKWGAQKLFLISSGGSLKPVQRRDWPCEVVLGLVKPGERRWSPVVTLEVSWALLLPAGQDTGLAPEGLQAGFQSQGLLLAFACQSPWTRGGFLDTPCPVSPCSLSSGAGAGVTFGSTQTPSLARSSPYRGEQRGSYCLPTGCLLCQGGTRDCTWCSLTSLAPSLPLFYKQLVGFYNWLLVSFLSVTSPFLTSTFLNILFITFLLSLPL